MKKNNNNKKKKRNKNISFNVIRKQVGIKKEN